MLKPFYPELTLLLLGERPVSIEEVNPGHAVTTKRFSDDFLLVRFRSGQSILLHLEFQLESRPDLPHRMAEYGILSLRALKPSLRSGAKLASVVVYLDPRTFHGDPGVFEYVGALRFKASVHYGVVKLWEKDPEVVLSMESPGLCPFLPMMRGRPEELVIRSLEKIKNTPDSLVSTETKGELATVLAGIASRMVEDKQLLRNIMSDLDALFGDEYVFGPIREKARALALLEGRVEGEKIGEKKGEKRGRAEDILQVLSARFGRVPAEIRKCVATIGDNDRLKKLIQAAARCEDIADFKKALPRG